ncbi:threonine dehydratase [Altererythrobacter atlanticus]|uniref:Phenylserine dehydratase n=1 Tax=Croceibacterium atlanticum TaxID=1267766 RepID=A0A0F7KQF4_9SPHN|nr:threonine/serine dehydratase [Croceibacterium atlanticum]AKH41809.1 Phenylserine dehydratase [Croceibacterium atlanticum]MBB5733275.1 threonine dehydratase [Croceibacterium atlanticum]
MTGKRQPTRDGVLRAAHKIAQILPPTPLLPVEIRGVKLRAKAECLQPIGVFKIRGAWHRLSDLSAEEWRRGVVGVSSGNHAQGVAWAARKLGMDATIVMPNDAPRVKVERVRELGAQIVTYDRPGGEDRDAIARELADRQGSVFVHAYGDPWVIEGQGSTGVEISAQMGEFSGSGPSRIVAPCGGGGLTAGIALACPDAEIVAVEPEGWDDVTRSLASGRIEAVQSDPPPTACDALQTPRTWPINFAVMKGRVAGVTVSEEEIRAAQRFAFAQLRLVLEPGGAAALAAALAGKVELDPESVLVLSGGNVDQASFRAVLDED